MPRIICFGEILVDFIAKGATSSLTNSSVFEKFSGGAPANTASVLGRLNADVAMLGSIGADLFGEFLKKSLDDFGVNTNFLQALKNRPTAVVFASLNTSKVPEFHSFGDGVAYNYFVTNKKVIDLVQRSKILHFTSIPLIQTRPRKETIKILNEARKSGTIISFDPNIRLHLFKSKSTAKKLIMDVLFYPQVLKFGKEEFHFLFGNKPVEKTLAKLVKQGARLILITDGKKGSLYYFKGQIKRTTAFPVKVRDTIGAGDAFIAGILSRVASFNSLSEISFDEMDKIVLFSTAVAAISITKKGATTALPTENQVKRFLVSHKKATIK